MEHRPPHYPPTIRRYINEREYNLFARAFAATELDREKFFVDSHRLQLNTVPQDVSRRDPSEANQFPFLCVFHWAGCDQAFDSKRAWKEHVVSQHLKLSRVFWECTEGDCAQQCTSTLPLQTKAPRIRRDLYTKHITGRHFATIHGFRTHLINRHRPTKLHDDNEDLKWVLDTELLWLLDRQDSSLRMECGLPQDLGCPMPQCVSVRFTGPTAWDQRLNHAAEHFLANPQCVDVFGDEKDAELVEWASSDKVAICRKTPNAYTQQHDCNKSVADSGYSSMPGIPRQPNMSEHGDSSPAVPSKMPESASDATFHHRCLEQLYLSEESTGIGGWARDDEYPVPLIDQETFYSTLPSWNEIYPQDESRDGQGTLDTSQDSDSGGQSDGTQDHNPETAAVMQWFHRWLPQWLAPLTQERPNGNGGRQSTAPQTQNPTSTSSSSSSSSSSTQKKGTSRPRRLPKRKRDDGDEDDGNEESSKSQRVDGDSEIRMFACPYFKRNPRKYGQPKWKSCAHPGYRDIHRVKEHMYRRHSLPEYQCLRCRMDLETSEALEAHSQQLEACTPCIGAQDGLNQDQVKKMRSKKGTGKNKSEGDRWNDVYSIAFPYDQQTPSPYLYDTDDDQNAREFNLCHEFGRFLTRELPPLVARRLSTVGCPLPETIKDDIEQYVKGLVPQLQCSFLEEMGFVTGDSSGQLDLASTTNDGASFVESTTSRHASEDSATTLQSDSSTSEHPMATFTKGSTSQELMVMFPTSDGSKELAMMPQVGYDTAHSTMSQDRNFSGHAMMLPASQTMAPYFSPTPQDWQVIYQQLGYDPNNPLGFGGMNTS
ncbi:hypothetical protein FGADI_906 [Fusarium gaditjirri]|uniref:C2H2-type domain-containing protein n=1 Tax=Fusarium gaditjirri TaxID=282569 RepID=A0A8H4X4A6_9HYPO|nr:hypothetical protein FGADI_906 [Fusarium gaditjirri]